MIQIFFDLEITTEGQRLYNFTKDTKNWVKKNKRKVAKNVIMVKYNDTS